MADRQAIAPLEQFLSRPLNAVVDDLESYAQLLTKWQQIQNLVSRETLPQIWTRHFADSLQVLKLLRPEDESFLDLGSGGGFPAIPLAIALEGQSSAFHPRRTQWPQGQFPADRGTGAGAFGGG